MGAMCYMVEIHVVNTKEDLRAALDLRVEVFVDEQKIPVCDEVDHLDNIGAILDGKVIHVVAISNLQIVGTARIIFDVPEDEYPHIGRVAVKRIMRDNQIGRSIMNKLHHILKEKGYPGVTLSAQVEVKDFYIKLGYMQRGETYMDVGIPHQDMDYIF